MTTKEIKPANKLEHLQKHLQDGKSINGIEAYRLWGLINLPSTIGRLTRERGVEISKVRIRVKNSMGELTMCNEYRIKVKPSPREWTEQPIEQ
jgi:hypothetical protein